MADEQATAEECNTPLVGKVAWVTGGASGIGLATARKLRVMGARVEILDIKRPQSLPENEIVHSVDISKLSAVEAVATELEEKFGGPDILVNSAGAPAQAAIADHDPGLWDRMIAVNLTGAFYMARRVLTGMQERRWGRIVMVSSDSAYRAAALDGAYSAAKAGVVALSRAIAMEGGAYGITSNVISPGLIDTPMTRSFVGSREALQEAAETPKFANPIGVVLEAEDLAHAAGFLCHPDSRHITGQVLSVNAGGLMR